MPVEPIDPGDPGKRAGPPALLGPIHAFGAACFVVFGGLYLALVDSRYMFTSNLAFGALAAANWWLVPRRWGDAVRATTFLAIVYIGLINVAVHLGIGPTPMGFWGMSVAIAAAFLFQPRGAMAWWLLCLGFYPLAAWLKAGPLAARAIPLTASQHEVLSAASYVGLLSFLMFTFGLFRRRLDAALRELQERAQALQASEARLAESQQVARIGTYDFDVGAGRWTSSPLLDEILGVTAQTPRDVDGWLAMVHPADRGELRGYLYDEVLARGSLFDRDYRLAPKPQEPEVWVHGRGVVQRDQDGRPVRMVGTIQDVTGLKRAEAERRVLEARLFHAQKLESLGVLAGGIAHDFNNLLTGTLGHVTLARAALPADRADLARSLQQAETAVLRAAELTHQMLAFAGKGKFVVQPLDLNQALSEMADLLRASLPRAVAFRFQLDPQAPWIVADASQVRQVVMNLIINAAEAIGDEVGVVTLRTSVREVGAAGLPGGETHGHLEPGAYACIEVEDDGCGMDEATLARIFEPFFTTKFTGRGLGLAAALGIVKGHRGAIGIRSAPGRGTTFTLAFPRVPPGEAQASDDRPAEAALRAGGRVLVVDDEPVVRNLVEAVLHSAGFEVVTAEDGVAGLEVVERQGANLDLVVLDLTMPRMGGVEALAAIRRLYPAMRVVVMSGYTRDNVETMFKDPVPDDVLEKPFRSDSLLAMVRKTLAA